LGFGYGVLGIGDWGLGPIPNPQQKIEKYIIIEYILKYIIIIIK